MQPLILDKRFNGTLGKDINDYPGGIIIPVDKPYRWTSADVIRKVKYAAIRHFGKKNLKVGHAGTLDPLATGVLLVCIGNATKLAEDLQRHDKEYIAGITFGATTPSYDLEKDIDARYPVGKVDEASVREALEAFAIGEQDQVAPLFSAKSVDGVRAYELARKAFKAGEPIPDDILRAARITISECELLAFAESAEASSNEAGPASNASSRINVAEDDLSLPHALVRIACSKGTYVRAFARDLGEAMDSGAYLCSLVRSRSGEFKVSNAISVENAISILVQ
ncbi:MAG: tRNA pseudouridine(55) synthase TruB [Bacteroidales bacterium]|nr:tRNA pseudouridine(55) synthase TruB [Bacteroidales bacterium]